MEDQKSKNFCSLGIDPNSKFVAWGLVSSQNKLMGYGTIENKNIAAGLDKIVKQVTSTGIQLAEFLVEDFRNYGHVIGKDCFDTIKNIGAVFMYCQIRGYKFRVLDKPSINKYLSNRGSSKKNDIAQIVMWYLGLKEKPKPVHCVDSIACAIASKNLVMQERCRLN